MSSAEPSKAAREQRLHILHLEDNPEDAALIRATLMRAMDCEVQLVRRRFEFEAALAVGGFEVVLSDYSLPEFDGISALAMSRRLMPEAAFIFVSGTIGEEKAVEALMAGAVDYVVKDRLGRLTSAIWRAVREAQNRSDRLRIEEELRERNELFRQINEGVDDAIAVLNLKGRLVFANRAHEELYGDLRSIADLEPFTQVHPDDRERILAAFRETVAIGKGRCIECRCLEGSGRIRHVESQHSVIRDLMGKVAFGVVVSRDITAREQAAMKIRQQAALLDQVPDAIIACDLDQRITYWNRGAERLYGWSAAEALGRLVCELLQNETAPVPGAVVRKTESRMEGTDEFTRRTKDGREVIVASRRAALRTPPAGRWRSWRSTPTSVRRSSWSHSSCAPNDWRTSVRWLAA